MISGDQDHRGPPNHHGTLIMTCPCFGCNESIEFGVVDAVESLGLNLLCQIANPVFVGTVVIEKVERVGWAA